MSETDVFLCVLSVKKKYIYIYIHICFLHFKKHNLFMFYVQCVRVSNITLV